MSNSCSRRGAVRVMVWIPADPGAVSRWSNPVKTFGHRPRRRRCPHAHRYGHCAAVAGVHRRVPLARRPSARTSSPSSGCSPRTRYRRRWVPPRPGSDRPRRRPARYSGAIPPPVRGQGCGHRQRLADKRPRSPPDPDSRHADQTQTRRRRRRLALAICHCWRGPMAERMEEAKHRADVLAARHRARLAQAAGSTQAAGSA